MPVVVLLVLLGCWKLTAAELLSSDIASPSDLALHNGSILGLFLVLGCLTALIGCWGRKARWLTALPLVLTSSRLVVLAVLLLLLLLRELSLELLLMLVLVLLSLRVTLLELLG
jgi:hypothetical protein